MLGYGECNNFWLAEYFLHNIIGAIKKRNTRFNMLQNIPLLVQSGKSNWIGLNQYSAGLSPGNLECCVSVLSQVSCMLSCCMGIHIVCKIYLTELPKCGCC